MVERIEPEALQELDDETLADYGIALDQELQSIRDRKKEVQDERDRRALEQKLSGFSDAEREQLGLPPVQVVQPAGIESEEAFGGDES